MATIERLNIPTSIGDIAQSKFGVTNGAYEILSNNPTRRSGWISNEGTTQIWLGASSNVQAGASGINFARLEAGSNTVFEHYSGPVWAKAGGASLAPVYVGTLDIG